MLGVALLHLALLGTLLRGDVHAKDVGDLVREIYQTTPIYRFGPISNSSGHDSTDDAGETNETNETNKTNVTNEGNKTNETIEIHVADPVSEINTTTRQLVFEINTTRPIASEFDVADPVLENRPNMTPNETEGPAPEESMHQVQTGPKSFWSNMSRDSNEPFALIVSQQIAPNVENESNGIMVTQGTTPEPRDRLVLEVNRPSEQNATTQLPLESTAVPILYADRPNVTTATEHAPSTPTRPAWGMSTELASTDWNVVNTTNGSDIVEQYVAALNTTTALILPNATASQGIIAITTLWMSVEIDFEKFSVGELLHAIVVATGADQDLVQTLEVKYVIRVTLWIAAVVTQEQIETGLIRAHHLPGDAVSAEVDGAALAASPRRLLGRRLAGVQARVRVTLVDKSFAMRMMDRLQDLSELQAELAATGVHAAVAIMSPPTPAVAVVVRIIDMGGKPYADTDAKRNELESTLSAALGVKVVITRNEVGNVTSLPASTLQTVASHFGGNDSEALNFTVGAVDVATGPVDMMRFAGELILNVTNASSFVQDSGAIAALRAAVAEVFGVEAENVRIALRLVPGLDPSDSFTAVEVDFIVEVPEVLGLEYFAHPPSVATFETAIQASLGEASMAGNLLDDYMVTVASSTAVRMTGDETSTNATVPPAPECGDGILNGTEAEPGGCDDGNTDNGDGCDSSCRVEPGWVCEVAGEPCKTVCGDGLLVVPSEQCDDGNLHPYDGCSPACRLEMGRCALQATRTCFGAWVPRLDVHVLQFCAGLTCALAECCRMPSRVEMVGTRREAGWQCPPGGFGECSPVCGDGLREGSETEPGRCDDGNARSGDGCDAACFMEPGWYCKEEGQPCETVCGDSEVGRPAEECDDGNTASHDGCGSACQLERGRCEEQAATLCVGGFEMRADVPPLAFCRGTFCAVAECCQPRPESCAKSVGGAMVASCTEGYWYTGDLPSPPLVHRIGQKLLQCSDFSCPAPWPRRQADSVCAEGPCADVDVGTCSDGACPDVDACSNTTDAYMTQCMLGACCRPRTVTCTCADARCCAQALLPPPHVAGGSSGPLQLDLVDPVAVVIGGQLRWYYYMRADSVSLSDLAQAFAVSGANGANGPWAMVLQGYLLRLPTVEELAALFASRGLVPTAPSATEPDGLWQLWSSTPNEAEVSPSSWWALSGRPGSASTTRYTAPKHHLMQVFLEVSEAFTVAHTTNRRLERRRLQDGMLCCTSLAGGGDPYVGELAGVPPAAEGATFFALSTAPSEGRAGFDQSHGSLPAGGVFTVFVQVPATVLLIAADDRWRRFAAVGDFSGGFAGLGWERVDAPHFTLVPLGMPMGMWRRSLAAGSRLEVPHSPGIMGSIAVRPA